MSSSLVIKAGVVVSTLLCTDCSDNQTFSPALSPTPQTSYQVPASIDPTGTLEVSSELNVFLASVPDSSVIEFPTNARYRIDGVILLQNRRNLTIEGNNALFFATTDGREIPPPTGLSRQWPRNRYHLEIRGGRGIVIRNVMVRGANPNGGIQPEAYVSALEAQHGFAIHDASDVELDRVRVTDVYGDFVYIGGTRRGPWSRNIHIHGSHFERNGRQGIAVTRGQGIVIERNYIGDTRRATFDLEPNSVDGGALDVMIRENEIGQGRLKFVASGGAGPNVSFTVEKNILHRAMTIDVETPPQYRRGPIRVVGNVSDEPLSSPHAVLNFVRVDGLVVEDNHQPVNERRSMTFLRACDSTRVDVQRNEVPGAARESEVIASCVTGREE